MGEEGKKRGVNRGTHVIKKNKIDLWLFYNLNPELQPPQNRIL